MKKPSGTVDLDVLAIRVCGTAHVCVGVGTSTVIDPFCVSGAPVQRQELYSMAEEIALIAPELWDEAHLKMDFMNSLREFRSSVVTK